MAEGNGNGNGRLADALAANANLRLLLQAVLVVLGFLTLGLSAWTLSKVADHDKSIGTLAGDVGAIKDLLTQRIDGNRDQANLRIDGILTQMALSKAARDNQITDIKDSIVKLWAQVNGKHPGSMP
ncbi:MAG TPA: hypothetical protein VHQ39_08055 [Dongiaceae bacterium]|jgi:hypothetical protein|nr:hypothetical protein [Dongiaceae bacterium]